MRIDTTRVRGHLCAEGPGSFDLRGCWYGGTFRYARDRASHRAKTRTRRRAAVMRRSGIAAASSRPRNSSAVGRVVETKTPATRIRRRAGR
jgi:hypothetical protein